MREILSLLMKDPKTVVILASGNATTGVAGLLDWIPQSDLSKISIILGIGVTIPLIFSHWFRACKDFYDVLERKREYNEGEE